MTLRTSESGLARDVCAVLENIERDVKAIIEREDHEPLAVMKPAPPAGRKLSECIAFAKAYEAELGYAPLPDADFAKDVQGGIDSRRDPIRNVWEE
jgi:hypothetical protein